MNSVLDQINPLLQRLSEVGYRLPVVLGGAQEWAIGQVQSWVQQRGVEAVLWFSQKAPPDAWTLPQNRINHELGRECKVVVFDLYSGLNLDALASLSGTVVAGGCLILISPELETLPAFEDPFASQLAVVPWSEIDVGKNFLARLAQQLMESPQVAVLSEHQVIRLPQKPVAEQWQQKADVKGCVTTDQKNTVDAIRDWLSHPGYRPFVIQADRGRGKSAAMGIAVRDLIQSQCQIAITAPRPQAVETFMRFATAYSSSADQAKLSFIAPDRLLETMPRLDLLLVDEAAAIAPSLLAQMVTRYPKVILATTVQGYEGTGRGFHIRFKPFLDQNNSGWHCQYLTEPVRWQKGDWLENTLNTAMILEAPTAPHIPPEFKVDGCEFAAMAPSEVEQAVHLLVDAHYRTRPNDIRTLLDGANIRSFVMRWRDTVVAIGMVAIEGDIPQDLAESILLGKRRPRGQNLAQSLAVHLYQIDALQSRLWRVVRIAVHPKVQNSGLGSLLLKKIEQQASEESVDVVGSLFSASTSVLQFWRGNRYSLLRVGYNREATTGANANLVAKGLSSKGVSMVAAARDSFRRDFPFALLESHRELSIEQAISIVDYERLSYSHLEQDIDLVKGYIEGRYVYENVAPALWRWLWSDHASRKLISSLDQDAASLVVLKALQKHHWSYVIRQLNLTGIKQARTLLRQAFGDLYE